MEWMTSKEKVLAVYPRAWAEHVDNVLSGKWWHIRLPYAEITGRLATQEDTWLDAASRLPPAPPEPEPTVE